jgi:HEAT repeat protein
MKRFANTTLLLVCVLGLPCSTKADEFEDPIRSILERMTSGNEEARLQARFDAPKIGAPAIGPLGGLMTHDDVNVRVAALAAVELIVHHAGRPGGVEERGAVCAELVKLFEIGSDDVTRESVHMLGYIAGDRSVPAIAELLNDSDEHTRETARLTLERIPGDASIDALLNAVEASDDTTRPRMLYSLSKKGSPRVIETLESHAKAGTQEDRLTALEGLARMGVKTAGSLFEDALQNPRGIDQGALYRKYLLLADTLNERVSREAAVAIFRKVLGKAPDGYLREHALLGLCPAGSAENVEQLLASLSDPSRRVQRLALRHVAMLEGSSVGPQIREAYSSAAPEIRPALLRALATVDPKGADELLKHAATANDSSLKITALDVTGKLDQPDLTTTYLELAETGSPAIRAVAIKGYLATAQGEISRGKNHSAADMFQKVIEGIPSSSLSDRTLAVQGLVDAAELRSVDTLSKLVADSKLSNDAARGMIKLARLHGDQGKKDKVIPHLKSLLTSAVPGEIVASAAETLMHLGVDPQAAVKKQGFLLDWMMTTPIMDDDHTGFGIAHFPEKLLAAGKDMGFDEIHNIGPRRVRWRALDQLSSDGSVNLVTFFRRTQNCLSYGYSELHSDSDRDVVFKIGSDDTIKCWVNGEESLANGKPHDFKIDDAEVSVGLKKGVNTVLIKITQSAGPWAFSFRITDTARAPIDSSTFASP